MRGAKIPAEFVEQLARGFSVNPDWILLGKGRPYEADAARPERDLSDKLLSLSRAMEATARMKLGAVASDESLRLIRSLDHGLRQLKSIQDQAKERFEPLLQQLIVRARDALKRRDLDEAEGLITAADKFVELGQSAEYRTLFESVRCNYLTLAGRPEQALGSMRRLAFAKLGSGDPDHPDTYIPGYNYMKLLCDLELRRQAIEFGLALLELSRRLTESEFPDCVDFLIDFIELERGSVSEKIGSVLAKQSRLANEEALEVTAGAHFFALIAARFVRPSEAFALTRPSPGRSQMAIRCAIWLESPEFLEQAISASVGNGNNLILPTDPLADLAVSLLKSLDGDFVLLEEWHKRHQTGAVARGLGGSKHQRSIMRAQVLRLIGDVSGCVVESKQTEAVLERDRLELNCLCRALHYRNLALAAPDAESSIREDARLQLVKAHSQGLRCIEPWIQ